MLDFCACGPGSLRLPTHDCRPKWSRKAIGEESRIGQSRLCRSCYATDRLTFSPAYQRAMIQYPTDIAIQGIGTLLPPLLLTTVFPEVRKQLLPGNACFASPDAVWFTSLPTWLNNVL